MVSGWMGLAGGWEEQESSLAYISETIRCRKLSLGRDICWGCAMPWCGIDLAFGLAMMTLSLNILSGLYLRHCKI